MNFLLLAEAAEEEELSLTESIVVWALFACLCIACLWRIFCFVRYRKGFCYSYLYRGHRIVVTKRPLHICVSFDEKTILDFVADGTRTVWRTEACELKLSVGDSVLNPKVRLSADGVLLSPISVGRTSGRGA